MHIVKGIITPTEFCVCFFRVCDLEKNVEENEDYKKLYENAMCRQETLKWQLEAAEQK